MLGRGKAQISRQSFLGRNSPPSQERGVEALQRPYKKFPVGTEDLKARITHARLTTSSAVATESREELSSEKEFPMTDKKTRKTPKILIAGAGIGGLVLAVGLLKKGLDVQIFERDLTAIRGEGKYRGPIQVQSNALAALEAIDPQTAERVLQEGCVTGDRINGLCDGETGHWYVKFDTFHPAVDKGLPVTRVISRFVLQKLLAEACDRIAGKNIIVNDSVVCDYQEEVDETGKRRVWAKMGDGRRYEGDMLIGADGIWSKVRTKLIGYSKPTYSQYTCYTGISDFTPPDINTVGYRVFLGNRQYFVSSDVGDGKMQWYAFHKEAEGGKDEEGQKKKRLLDIFGHWTDMVTDLIKATPEEDVLRRDIFDRPPIFTWTKGHIALLGDSAHAMQPNLGQGGCMAIEDGYQLAQDLNDAIADSKDGYPDIPAVLQGYQSKRILRASTIHGLAGSAAIMASTYKAYLGEGLGFLGNWLLPLKIPHPGRVGGYVAMNLAMPAMLAWVLGGNLDAFKEADRNPLCHLDDKPKHFDQSDFYKFLKDDAALQRAANARWLVVPTVTNSLWHSQKVDGDAPEPASEGDKKNEGSFHLNAGTHMHGLRIALPEEATEICPDEGLVFGAGVDCNITVDHPSVSTLHAKISRSDGDYYLSDLGSSNGTWLNGNKMKKQERQRIEPGDEISIGQKGVVDLSYKIKQVHNSVWDQLLKLDPNAQHEEEEQKEEKKEAVAA